MQVLVDIFISSIIESKKFNPFIIIISYHVFALFLEIIALDVLSITVVEDLNATVFNPLWVSTQDAS